MHKFSTLSSLCIAASHNLFYGLYVRKSFKGIRFYDDKPGKETVKGPLLLSIVLQLLARAYFKPFAQYFHLVVKHYFCSLNKGTALH